MFVGRIYLACDSIGPEKRTAKSVTRFGIVRERKRERERESDKWLPSEMRRGISAVVPSRSSGRGYITLEWLVSACRLTAP